MVPGIISEDLRMVGESSRTAYIRALAMTDRPQALHLLAQLLSELFSMQAEQIEINDDQYSLNSLNGFFQSAGEAYFFKFHQEEGEEAMSGEYYRADVLAQAGFPVDQPIHVSARAGEQILIYRRRSDPRFSDVLRQLDTSADQIAIKRAVAAEVSLNQQLLAIYRQTLHPITPEQSGDEPIHRLFHDRLVDPRSKRYPGGRFGDFYVGQSFRFPADLVLDWQDFASCQFVINGKTYARTVGDLFTAAEQRLRPGSLADAGGIVAHGDAHNANVWYREALGQPALSYFDPAFAGRHVPSLMAEIKPTFHNIFAHPLWLYEPALASRHFSAKAVLHGRQLHIETDWQLSPIRQAMLDTKARYLWRPLLEMLQARDLLPPDWRDVIRLGLFLSPTLVMNLRAGVKNHDPVSSLIAFSTAVMVGSPPVDDSDIVSNFLDWIDPGLPHPR
jgi:hypothetical protein